MDDDEQRLLSYLFTNHDPRLRPVINKSQVVTVTFGISLHQIIDVVRYGIFAGNRILIPSFRSVIIYLSRLKQVA